MQKPPRLHIGERDRGACKVAQRVTSHLPTARPLSHQYGPASGDLRHDQVYNERVWAKAIHRIVTEGISPEQAVDDAIVRIMSGMMNLW